MNPHKRGSHTAKKHRLSKVWRQEKTPIRSERPSIFNLCSATSFLSDIRRIAWVLLVSALSLSLQAGIAVGSSFSVNPVQVFLTSETPSALLTLRNESSETSRFQLKVFAWDQSPKGEILLRSTDDIIFYPVLLSLAAGEERRVRVGTKLSMGPTEKSYRIFISEIPSVENPRGTRVAILTEVGIPIFLTPSKKLMEVTIGEMAVRKGLFSFHVKNSGNVHTVVQVFRVQGIGAAQDVVWQRQVEGWYVLAGGHRSLELNLPKGDCVKLKSLTVEVEMIHTTLRERLDLPPGACG